MSGLLNINIQEGATFSKALSFTKTVEVIQGVHPITKEPVVVYQKVPLDITGMRLVGQIRDSFTESSYVQDLDCQVIGGTAGRASIGLSREQTARLAQVATLLPTGIGCSKTFRIGYYDLIAVDANSGSTTKLFSGTVFLTRAATKDPEVVIDPTSTTYISEPVAIGSPVTLNVGSAPIKFTIGVKYLRSGVTVTPTGGSVVVTRKTSSNPNETVGTLSAITPSQSLQASGVTISFTAAPNNIINADSYQLVVVGSLY